MEELISISQEKGESLDIGLMISYCLNLTVDAAFFCFALFLIYKVIILYEGKDKPLMLSILSITLSLASLLIFSSVAIGINIRR
jgi:hypothetical protein